MLGGPVTALLAWALRVPIIMVFVRGLVGVDLKLRDTPQLRVSEYPSTGYSEPGRMIRSEPR